MPKGRPKVQTAGDALSVRDRGLLVLAEMAETGDSARSLCSKHGISNSAFYELVNGDENFAEHYARARDAQADIHFDRLDDLGSMALQADSAVQVAALRLVSDNQKWKLARMSPKKYGDKQNLEHTGSVNLTLFDGEQARRMAQQLNEDQPE